MLSSLLHLQNTKKALNLYKLVSPKRNLVYVPHYFLIVSLGFPIIFELLLLLPKFDPFQISVILP